MRWYEDMYERVDQKDLDAVSAWFADDVVSTTGDGEPVVGRDAVIDGLRGFQSTFATLAHAFIAVVEQGNVTMLEARTRFTLASGVAVDIKGVTVYERRDGLVTSMRMYADMSPLWVTPEAAV